MIGGVWTAAVSMSDNVANSYEADAIKDFANNTIGVTWLLNIIWISLKIFAYYGLKNRSWIGYYCNMILIISTPFTIALTTWSKNYLESLGYLYSYIKPNMDEVLVMATMHFVIAFIFWTVPHLYYFNKFFSISRIFDCIVNYKCENTIFL